MAHPSSLLLFFLGLSHIARAAVTCPKEKVSPGREVVCYSSVHDVEHITESICKCTTLVHQGHDLRNLSTSDIEGLRKSLKQAKPALQFLISVNDPSNLLLTSATVRQEAAARITSLFHEVDGVELNVTAGSKERLFHFLKNLKDETVRKFQDKRILLNLPTRPETLAKQFDLKELAKYVDLFTISTHYLVDEDEAYKTFHPSRMMGLFDMLNTDSLVDLITGLGGPKRKLLISVPASAYKFTLKSEAENTPRSATVEKEPLVIDRKQLCEMMSDGEWTIERDEDLTAPYAFKNQTWVAFDDEISAGIKGKYVILRDLAGIGIHEVENDLKTDCANFLTHQIHRSFMDLKRKTRQAVLNSLEDELHQAQISYSSGRVKSSEYRVVRVVDTEGHIRAVRENTQTEFSCPSQGYFVHPRSCNRFYRCVKFNQEVEDYSVFEFDCPAGLAFDERTEVCVWPHSLSEGSACPGSSEIAPSTRVRFRCPSQPGYYADKQNCRWFFACMDLGGAELTAYEFRCPFGLVFDEQRLVCEWPWLVPSCSDSGSGYVRTEYSDINYGSESSDRGINAQQHFGSFGFSGLGSVDLSGSAHAGAAGFTGSTTEQHQGTIGVGIAAANHGQYHGESKGAAANHGQYHGESEGAAYFAPFEGQTEGSSVRFGSTAAGYSAAGHSLSPDGQYYGSTSGEGHSSAAGNTYFGSTASGYEGPKTFYQHSTSNGGEYLHSAKQGHVEYVLNGYTGHEGVYADKGRSESIDSEYSTATSNQEHSGHSLLAAAYPGETSARNSEAGSNGYTESSGKYDGSTNLGDSASPNEGFYGPTSSENSNQRDDYFHTNDGRSSGLSRGFGALTNAGSLGYSVGGVAGSISTNEYQSDTSGSVGASIYSNSVYGSSGGDKTAGTTATYGNNVVSSSDGSYPTSVGAGYAFSYGTSSPSQFGYAGSLAGDVKDIEQTNTGFRDESKSGGYVHSVVPATRNEYAAYAGFTSTGIHESGGPSSTTSGLPSGFGYFGETTKEYTSPGISAGNLQEPAHAVDLTKLSQHKSHTGDDLSSGQFIGFASGQSPHPANSHGHSGTNGYGQSYGSTGASLHPGQFTVTPTYYGGFTTGEKATEKINVTLIDISNSFPLNTQFRGSVGTSNDYNLGSSLSNVHGFTGGYTYKETSRGNHHFGPGVVTGQTVARNSLQDTTVTDESAGGAFATQKHIHGTIEAGVIQPGYVSVGPGSPGYVATNGIKSTHFESSIGSGTLTYGPTAPGILLTETIAPNVIFKGQTSSGAYIGGETAPSISLGGTTAHQSSGGSQYTSNVQSSSFYSNSGHADSGLTSYSGSAQPGEYSPVSTVSPLSRETDQHVLDYHNEKDIPDYRPSSTIVPDTIVSGGIENIGNFVHNSHGLFEDQANSHQTTSSGFSTSSTGTHTQSGFTKTGPTKTGITVATLGGRGSYVISTGYPKPEINANNIGEKAFEGNVAGHVEASTQPAYNVQNHAYPTSTAASNIHTSSQSHDISDIDTSKITLLAPTGSTGYSYPKPSVSFGTDTTAYSTAAPTPADNRNVIVSSTTSKPPLNIHVYNTPSVVGSAPVTASLAVVNTYSPSKFEQDAYQASIFTSSKASSGLTDSTFSGKRPSVTILSSTSSPPLPYTPGSLDSYKTTVFDAAKIPLVISTAQQPAVSSTVHPVDYNNNKVSYNGGTYETVTSTVRPSSSYLLVESKTDFLSSSTPRYEETFTTAKPQIMHGASGSVTASSAKGTFEHNVTPSATADFEYGRKNEAELTYSSSSTAAPALGVTYRTSLPTSNPDTFKGYSYPKPTISTDSGDYPNRGYKMTILGSSITTAGSMSEQDIEKFVSDFGRGTLKYTPSYYESSADAKVTASPAANQPTTHSPMDTECEYGRKHTGGYTRVSSATPKPPVITTYSGGYSKLPKSTTSSPSYEISRPTVAVGVGKGKVIVKWSDLHPLLLAKLGAQCTCKADPFGALRGPASKKLVASSKGQVNLSNYDESDIYVDIDGGSDESGEYKEDYSTVQIPASDPKFFKQASSAASGTPTGTYLPSVSLHASSSTYLPSASAGEPPTAAVSLISDNRFARKLNDDGPLDHAIDNTIGHAEGARGASFDRYGPGGLRDSAETLEGVSDCARPGLFRHPNFCNKFYACHWDEWKKKFTLHVFNCPVHLTFDSGVGACNWPSKGPACQDDNLLV